MKNKIVLSFLNDLDLFIKENKNNITGNDLSMVYHDFGSELKRLSGISANYEWLTEFLIFRFVYHTLGHSLDVVQDTASKVVFKKDNIALAPNKSFKDTINGSPQEPDITYLENGEIKFLISVKCKAINVYQDFDRIKNLRFKEHSSFKSVTVTFSQQGKKNLERMSNIEKLNSWHRYIVLQDNGNLLIDELICNLKLSQL